VAAHSIGDDEDPLVLKHREGIFVEVAFSADIRFSVA